MSKAPKKKGLSIEEKVTRIEEWFTSHPIPYTLKELIAILPKATGVIPQSIEECLELLVSEGRIQQKKIGINVLFWLFPKTAAQQLAASFSRVSSNTSEVSKYLNMSLPQMEEELDILIKKENELRQKIQKVRDEIGNEELIQKDNDKIQQLQKELKDFQNQMEKASMFDPIMIDKIKSMTMAGWEAANRWTDNIYLLEQNISQRMGLTSRDLRVQLQIPSDIDYIDFDELLPEEKKEMEFISAALIESSDVINHETEVPAAYKEEIQDKAHALFLKSETEEKSIKTKKEIILSNTKGEKKPGKRSREECITVSEELNSIPIVETNCKNELEEQHSVDTVLNTVITTRTATRGRRKQKNF